MMDEKRRRQLSRLECPFTWKIYKSHTDKVTWNLKQVDTFIPEVTFTRFILLTYIQMLDLEYDKAAETLAETEPIIEKFQNTIKKELSKHIFEATKANLLIRKGNSDDEVDEIIKNIKIIDDEIYLSSLSEFKASIWTHLNYSPSTANIAIEFAKDAIKEDPKAATAHYLLARNLRTSRRMVSVFSRPDEDEIRHIKRAYELQYNPKFGLFVAQILKENQNIDEAMTIFLEINQLNFQDTSIQLRLAFAFLQANDLKRAEKCLGFVEEHNPESSMFLHYKGIYLMKKQNYEEAAKYLLKAGKTFNYSADMSYITCMIKSRKQFDLLDHLFLLLEKYFEFEKPWGKEILLNIAFCYFYKNNLEKSIQYFLLGLQIKEDNFSLEKFWIKCSNRPMNVQRFLKTTLLAEVQRQKSTFSEEIILETEKLKKLIINN